MPKIRITLRAPGNHHEIWHGELSFVPREGEAIVLPGQSAGQTVHAVAYDVATDTAILLVRPL